MRKIQAIGRDVVVCLLRRGMQLEESLYCFAAWPISDFQLTCRYRAPNETLYYAGKELIRHEPVVWLPRLSSLFFALCMHFADTYGVLDRCYNATKYMQ